MTKRTTESRSRRPTIYVPAEEMYKIRKEYDGVAYGPIPTVVKTYVTKNAIYRIESDLEIAQGDDFQRACQEAGLGTCGSWATVARRIIRYPYRKYSATTALLEKTGTAQIGGWIWSVPNAVMNHAVQYDMNKAYQWSLLSNVSWNPEYRIYEGFRRDASIVIAHVRVKRYPGVPLPAPLNKGNALVALSPADIERFNCTAVIPYWSIVYGPPNPYHALKGLRQIRDWPQEWKEHVLRVAWGNFAMRDICGSTWRGGKPVNVWRNKNTLYDPARAHIVSSNVKSRIFDALPYTVGACRIYVDSITCMEAAIGVGTDPGQWRLNKRLERIKVHHGGRLYDLQEAKAST